MCFKHLTRKFQSAMIVKINDLVDGLDTRKWRSSVTVPLKWHSNTVLIKDYILTDNNEFFATIFEDYTRHLRIKKACKGYPNSL